MKYASTSDCHWGSANCGCIALTDNLSPDDRKKAMRAVKSQRTSLERCLRGILISNGFRGWKVNPPDLVGHPDFAFEEERLAVFVDGCFWHGCPTCKRPLPKSNENYWRQKIQRNVDRDRSTTAKLRSSGWGVIRIWGHELKDPASYPMIADKIRARLKSRVQKSF